MQTARSLNDAQEDFFQLTKSHEQEWSVIQIREDNEDWTQYDFVKDPRLLSNMNSLLAWLHALSAPNKPDSGEPQIQQASAPEIVLKKHLLPVVQQLQDQVDCGSRRLEGELKDWRPPPVQNIRVGVEAHSGRHSH
jgi:hypothetical protein